LYCYGISTYSDRRDLGVLDGQGSVFLEVDALQLTAGHYNISAGIHRPGGIGSAGGIGLYDLREFAFPFAVTSERADLGVVCLSHAWRLDAERSASAEKAPTVRAFDRVRSATAHR
jgi:hypothetical protein